MILKKITYYWWYLFYSAYWTAYHLGEKENPESNANYYFNLLIGFNLFGIAQLAKFIGYDLSIAILVIICVLPAILIPYFSFEKGGRCKIRMNEFNFLKNQSHAKRRHILLIVLALWSLLFNAIGGIIRM